jgi:type III restriction enzyme
MAVKVSNSELVLKMNNVTDEVIQRVNKYDDYLEALFSDDYSFLREATKTALSFLLSTNYPDLETLAMENYLQSEKLQQIFPSIEEYLNDQFFPLRSKKACSLDLATGSGKSYLLFAITQLALCEEIVDRVLVLCPSLTIEEGLTDKFNHLNSNGALLAILRSINPDFIQPEIINANDTILPNNICIENVHATYSRTGSSIQDSIKNDGEKVLVLNDEAHHIYSGASDSRDKKWLEFLRDENYSFRYIIGVSGTPYYRDRNDEYNQYFLDIIYRFSIKQATEKNIIKKLDPKKFDEFKDDKGYQDIWAVHLKIKEKYGKYLKPLTIVICANIADAIIEWKVLVDFLIERGIPKEEAIKKVIWVTSGLPSSPKDKARIAGIPERNDLSAEQVRKENLLSLKTVDSLESPVEWIVSVAMLTEGWDVKNVFLIVPHTKKAFNSKLLIAQVLGRGLRVPPILKEKVITPLITVSNHEKWTPEIMDLYNEVAELENRLSWGYDERHNHFAFPLYNLEYKPQETTTESKEEEASFPESFGFSDQYRSAEYKQEYTLSGQISYAFEDTEIYETDIAVANLYAYLKDKNERIVQEWSKSILKEKIIKELVDKGYESDFLSKDNYHKVQQAFGPLFRELGKVVPRISQVPDCLKKVEIISFPVQSFSENSLKNHGFLFYTESSKDSFQNEEKILFEEFSSAERKIKILERKREESESENIRIAYDIEIDKLRELSMNIIKVDEPVFKTPLNVLFVSYRPEIEFTNSLLMHIDLFKSFIKSSDQGFYFFPYSYKPDIKGKTHPRQETFNPDFFLKVNDCDDILIVEIKKEKDDNKKNQAKYRDGKRHFENLNEKLGEKGIPDRYYFKFLSPEDNDIANFFQAVQNKKYKQWNSILMNDLQDKLTYYNVTT